MWRWSHISLGLSFQDEVIVSSCAHFVAPVVSKVEHAGGIKLPPVLPSVSLDAPVVLLSVHVLAAPGDGADAVGVEPWVVWDIV